MNKFVKGSIAAAAATVLLLGGAGSLAYWNAEAGLAATGNISAGELTLTTANGGWVSGAPDLWVPGDRAVYEATLVLNAAGDNIEGDITLADVVFETGTSIDVSDQFEITLDADVAAATLDGDILTSGLGYSAGVIEFDGPGAYEIPVTVSVEFLYDVSGNGTANNDSQNVSVSLSDFVFTVTQTDPTL